MSLKLAGVILGIIVLIGAALTLSGRFNPQNPSENGTVCTQDVELCPDGSYVGRVPPDCKFAQCPKENNSARFSVVAENLEIPWALAFLPDDRMLVTERPGRVRMVDQNGNITLIATITSVKHIGEGGLLGIAVHPDFEKNRFIYLYYTFSGSGDNSLNRVARYKMENDQLVREQIIVNNIPGASNHNGGRIKFGPDRLLYITTGDAGNPSQAQDKNSLAGKILRVTHEGKVEVYSYGHRNPQGLAWDSSGRLWATEHGPSTKDELNAIEIGKNYGWPTIQGDEKRDGLETPVINSGSGTWAPAGAAFLNGKIYFGALRGEVLFQYDISTGTLKEQFKGQFGRIRDVVLGPDNFLYITTSNRDGRGAVQAGDDKIIRIDPQKI
ncbi:PQQ-dependent sugar dehydrogenase [Candidatus Daviesbacteria bacterium]|nr:PQQ-dependent sugar dehydrogenase [Candidatus Daviesbacteria bacterium]